MEHLLIHHADRLKDIDETIKSLSFTISEALNIALS